LYERSYYRIVSQGTEFLKLRSLKTGDIIKKLFLVKVNIFLLIVLAVLGISIYRNSLRDDYKKEYFQQDLYNNLHDFVLVDKIITSTSYDPWIYLGFPEGITFKYIRLDIVLFDLEETQAQFFYLYEDKDGYFTEADSVKQIIWTGINYVKIPYAGYKALRLDLTEHEGVSFVVNSVKLTNKNIPVLSVFSKISLVAFFSILWGTFFFLNPESSFFKRNDLQNYIK